MLLTIPLFSTFLDMEHDAKVDRTAVNRMRCICGCVLRERKKNAELLRISGIATSQFGYLER